MPKKGWNRLAKARSPKRKPVARPTEGSPSGTLPEPLTFWIPGKAVPWGLSRAGRIHTKPSVVVWQAWIRSFLRARVGRTFAAYSVPCYLELQFSKPGKGDLTNLVKAVEDGLVKAGVLADDRLVRYLRAGISVEWEGQPAGVRIEIRPIG